MAFSAAAIVSGSSISHDSLAFWSLTSSRSHSTPALAGTGSDPARPSMRARPSAPKASSGSLMETTQRSRSATWRTASSRPSGMGREKEEVDSPPSFLSSAAEATLPTPPSSTTNSTSRRGKKTLFFSSPENAHLPLASFSVAYLPSSSTVTVDPGLGLVHDSVSRTVRLSSPGETSSTASHDTSSTSPSAATVVIAAASAEASSPSTSLLFLGP